MRFSRQAYWSGLPFPSPGDLPNPGIEPGFPALQADALPSEPPGKGLSFLRNFYTILHGEGNGKPLQYPCLENPMDRGAWWAAVHGVTKSWARLSDSHLLTYLGPSSFRVHLDPFPSAGTPGLDD